MYLRDIMTTDVVTISSKANIIKAKRLMDAHKLKRIPVVDKGKLVGIITRRSLQKAVPPTPNSGDLLEFSYSIASLYRTPVSQIMRRDMVTATPDMTVEEGAALAQAKKVGALVVVDDSQVVGIVTTKDFFYKILNKVLGVGEPGARLEIPGGGEGKPLEAIISCLNKAGLNITSLHIYKRPGRAKKNIIIQVDSEDVDQCVTELKNMGYEVKLRRANSG